MTGSIVMCSEKAAPAVLGIACARARSCPGILCCRRGSGCMHSQAQQLVMQRLQRQAKPVLVPGDQAALLRDCRQAQPRLARVRIQQHRLLSQPACT